MISRRTVLGGVAATLLAPSTVRAQPARRVAKLGVLIYSDPRSDPNTGSLRDALRALGYVEGSTLAIEYRYAEGQVGRLAQLAAELVATKPDVIFALGGDVAPFAKAATSSIPIVISVSNDPVRAGVVRSLASPGGNVTGVTFLSDALAGKRLQLLKQAAPHVSRVAVIWNPLHHDDELVQTQAAGRTLGVQVVSAEVRDLGDFDGAFQAVTSSGADAVIVVSSRQTIRNRAGIAAFTARQRLPLAGGWGLWADSGALLSYGPYLDESIRRAVTYVDRILKGARPADLPVEQPTKFELVVNQHAAKALGLTIPQTLLVQADRVIS
ncbi:MAG: ABC transporter substrate-binding protein [Candidatus Rokubacteria bacterium]|nr:ABC transporter substrate-binding protein [Candidatus Rokubacteria bacterium]